MTMLHGDVREEVHRSVDSGDDPDRPALGPDVDPAHAALGRLSVLLGRTGADGLDEALQLLVDGLGLDSAVIRDARGMLRASAGELQLVDTAGKPVIEVPLGGSLPATMTAIGAVQGQLPLLRVAAAVLGLALSNAPAGDLVLLDEQDRDELADSLHDGPVQQLVVARYAADAAVRGGLDAREARDAVQGALVALRRTMWHLRPRGTDLATALEELAERLSEAGQRPLVVAVTPGAQGLGPAGTALAYRLVQTVALSSGDRTDPLAVTVHAYEQVVQVSLPSDPLPPARLERWDRRARALGGHLDVQSDRQNPHDELHLTLSLPVSTEPKAVS